MIRTTSLLWGFLVLAVVGCDSRNEPAKAGDGDAHGHPHDASSEVSSSAPEDHDHDDGHGHGAGHGHAHGPTDPHAGTGGDADGPLTRSLTAWGNHYEIFAALDAAVAGERATVRTRVTVLRGFRPLREGLVEVILRGSGRDHVFGEEVPERAGDYEISFRAPPAGGYLLVLRVEGPVRREEIAAGRVRVGTAEVPGGFIRSNDTPVGERVRLTKEQQWGTSFATAWAQRGELHLVARGPGRVRTVAGGSFTLAAPIAAVAAPDDWPHVGRDVTSGDPLFALVPSVAADRSLAELDARATEAGAALGVARDRLSRLESLLPAQATSAAEVEAARAQVTGLRAQYEAAESDLQSARAGRSGGASSGERVLIRSPLTGQVAAVNVSPGQIVSAGQTLGRVVQVSPYWVEAYLRPRDVEALTPGAIGLSLRGASGDQRVVFAPEDVRLVSRAPVVSEANGAVACIFEVTADASTPLGSAVECEVTLPSTRSGIVLPAGSLVDDAGISIVYEQHDAETFVRREVEVLAREGNEVLVRGVADGTRVVSLGGATIRRASLVSSGVGHGHVH